MRAIAAVALVLVAGCAREPIPALALACQTTKCTCLPSKVSFPVQGEPVPVQWKTTGEAHCPDGYVLRPVEKKTPPY